MSIIFDGRAFAQKNETLLRGRVRNLTIKPKLVSILVGDNSASLLYTNLKKKAAERIGAEMEVVSLNKLIELTELIKLIKKLNQDESVNGIMTQLPLPKNFSIEERERIINSIDTEKDVDGLRKDSKLVPPTAKAVLKVLVEALRVAPFWPEANPPLAEKARPCKVTVVGASGFMGRQIVRELEKRKEFKILQADIKTKDLTLVTKVCDVVISAAGVHDLIKANIVKDGAILIDVGAPKGDIEKAAYGKASFVSPVPGGVGPVTISCLLENLVEAVEV